MSHSHAGVICDHPTKKACAAARRVAMGQCTEMIDSKSDPYPCTNWAVDKVAGRGYCGQHIAKIVRLENDRQRQVAAKADLERRIDLFLAWQADHPSVWDRMPS